MTINKDRNKDRFENWQLCGAWKLPVLWPRSSLFQATLESSLFYGHGVIKLTQNQSLNQSPGAPPSFTRKYHSSVLECIHLLQCIAAHLPHTLPWVCREMLYLGISSADFYSGSVARSRKPIECMLKTVEKMLAVRNCLQKANGCSWSSRLWRLRRLGCDCLSNSCRPVVLNLGSEGRIRLPSTLCAALSSLSIKRLIFCVTDFVLL